MNTKISLTLLALLTFGVTVSACNGGGGGGGGPTFEDPAASPDRVDRMGRPGINTVVAKVLDTTGASSDAFNAADPSGDEAAFGAALGALVMRLHACPSAALAEALLPDVLTFDTTQPAEYLNGRELDDDVIDVTLQALYTTNGGTSYCIATNLTPAQVESEVLTDKVDSNDVAFPGTFPYLAAPH